LKLVKNFFLIKSSDVNYENGSNNFLVALDAFLVAFVDAVIFINSL